MPSAAVRAILTVLLTRSMAHPRQRERYDAGRLLQRDTNTNAGVTRISSPEPSADLL
jgi:hypothetical protein